MKLYRTAQEQDDYERLATLFAIITTIDRLENVYIKGTMEVPEYETACRKLLAQYKTLTRALASLVPDPMQFMDQYGMRCLAAREVIRFGEPSSIRENAVRESGNDDAAAALQVGTLALTVCDICMAGEADPAVMLSCDQLRGYINDVLKYLNKVNLPPDFSKDRIHGWVQQFNKMQAHEYLTEIEARQLRADMEDIRDRVFNALEARRT